MHKALSILLMLLLLPLLATAAPNITVSGNSVSILGTAQTISLTCTLIDPNQTGNLRSGSNIITVFVASTVTPGNVATCGPIYGNDVILDGFGNANTTYYKVQVFKVTGGIIASTPSLQNFYAFQGSGTVDLSTATPVAPSFMSGTNGSVNVPGTFTVGGSTVPTVGANNAFTGNNTHSGTETFTGPFASTGNNTFTGSPLAASFTQNTALIPGPCQFNPSNYTVNFNTEWQVGQSGTGSADLCDIGLAIPSTATSHGSNALGIFLNHSSTTTFGVGLYVQARPLVGNVTGIEAINPVFADAGNLVSHGAAAEFDCNISNNSTSGSCLQISGGGWVGTPTSFPALHISKPVGGGFTNGIIFDAGSSPNAALFIHEVATGASQGSQPISICGMDAGSTERCSSISADLNGKIILTPNASSGVVLMNGAVQQTGVTSFYNNISTAGQGLAWIPGATSQKAETGSADANVLTVTPAAVAGTYRACFTASVSSATSGVIGWTLSWTDSNGTAQSNIAQALFQQGTAAPALTFTVSAAGNYQSCSQIDVNNAAASIVVKWVGGGTTAAKVSATVERLI